MRTALVTGGAKRIGAAISRHLARHGWRVIIHYNRSAGDAQSLRDEIIATEGAAEVLQADLARREGVEGLMAAAGAIAGRVDLLINNASLFEHDTPTDIVWDQWDRHLRTNLTAAAFLCRDFSAQDFADAPGLIVNMLDQKVQNLNPDYFSYTISKYGLLGLTRVLAMHLAPRVRVCAIAPGVTMLSGKQSDESLERSRRATPLGISSTVPDILRTLTYIIDTPSLTGQVLTVDGGESLTGRTRDVAFDVGLD